MTKKIQIFQNEIKYLHNYIHINQEKKKLHMIKLKYKNKMIVSI
jgi:hypothetical protein